MFLLRRLVTKLALSLLGLSDDTCQPTDYPAEESLPEAGYEIVDITNKGVVSRDVTSRAEERIQALEEQLCREREQMAREREVSQSSKLRGR